MLELLIRFNADLEKTDCYGKTPLTYAIENNSQKIVLVNFSLYFLAFIFFSIFPLKFFSIFWTFDITFLDFAEKSSYPMVGREWVLLESVQRSDD